MGSDYKMRKNGFTLVEVIIAMTVGALIMVAVYGYMVMSQKNSANMDRRIVTQQDTRTVLDLMASEIRMASYNPVHNTSTWINPSPLACMPSVAVAPAAYKGIKIADTNNIAFATDLNASGTIGDAANEYIVYSYDGASTLTRSVNCVGAAILGGTAPFSNVRNVAANVNLFRYFDAGGNEITATVINNPASTVNGIPAIRRILITIVTDTTENDLNTKKPKRMVYSTSVIVRNHVLSP
jgi:prepilin-type N-terminal cleavage/methylation domain-containing protein